MASFWKIGLGIISFIINNFSARRLEEDPKFQKLVILASFHSLVKNGLGVLTSPDRCLLNKGARRSVEKQVVTPGRHDEGTTVTNRNAAMGERGDTITLHPGACLHHRFPFVYIFHISLFLSFCTALFFPSSSSFLRVFFCYLFCISRVYI